MRGLSEQELPAPPRVRVSPQAFPRIDDVCAELLRLSKAGLPAVIENVDALPLEDARRLLHLFLHEPDIVQPIDPFAALLEAMIRRRRFSLWDLLAPAPPRAREDAEEFLFALPRERPACLECRCFPFCQGYGAWVGACETWRAILSGLSSAARALSAVRSPSGAV